MFFFFKTPCCLCQGTFVDTQQQDSLFGIPGTPVLSIDIYLIPVTTPSTMLDAGIIKICRNDP